MSIETAENAIAKAKLWLGFVGGFIGVFTDILQPLGSYCKYLFLLGILAAIVLGIVFYTKQNLRQKLYSPLVFVAALVIGSGVMTVLQSGEPNDKGFLANNITAIENLQSKLGLIHDDIKDIQKTTKDIKQDTEIIKDTASDIKQDTTDIKESVSDVKSDTEAIKDTTADIKSGVDEVNKKLERKGIEEFSVELKTYDDAKSLYEFLWSHKSNIVKLTIKYNLNLKTDDVDKKDISTLPCMNGKNMILVFNDDYNVASQFTCRQNLNEAIYSTSILSDNPNFSILADCVQRSSVDDWIVDFNKCQNYKFGFWMLDYDNPILNNLPVDDMKCTYLGIENEALSGLADAICNSDNINTMYLMREEWYLSDSFCQNNKKRIHDIINKNNSELSRCSDKSYENQWNWWSNFGKKIYDDIPIEAAYQIKLTGTEYSSDNWTISGNFYIKSIEKDYLIPILYDHAYKLMGIVEEDYQEIQIKTFELESVSDRELEMRKY